MRLMASDSLKGNRGDLLFGRLTGVAREVLLARYLLSKSGGGVESPNELFQRVSVAAATAEKSSSRELWQERFFTLISSLRFLPNSPTLMNAGKVNGQLSACFVLPVEDSLAGIFESLKDAALIHQSGGGTGFSFSRLRPKGAVVGSSGGEASGPVSFLKIYDAATEAIKQGGTRRGANMGVLRVDHPDILEFIRLKRDFAAMVNFNLSVGITDSFMRCLEERGEWRLKDPNSGKDTATLPAEIIWRELVDSAWRSGDPGLVFLDRMNFFNPTPREGFFESTNPCGEQPLLPFESCNLGSLNVAAYFVGGEGVLNWAALARDIRIAVRFLDNIIDVNSYPVPQCSKATLRTRKIGLGLMGFADLLLLAGIPYDSAAATSLAERCMGFISSHARAASGELAEERGVFPGFTDSIWPRLGYPGLRNATVSTLAPTGTISLIAGCSSGIEPIFSAVTERRILDGRVLKDVHPVVSSLLALHSLGDGFSAVASVDQDHFLSSIFGPAWSPAHQVSVEGHLRMQAAFQRHSDSAVSKTVNLPQSAGLAEVDRAYRLAFRLGCKGITVFRDKSRPQQVLQRPEVEPGICSRECPEC